MWDLVIYFVMIRKVAKKLRVDHPILVLQASLADTLHVNSALYVDILDSL